MGRMANHEVTYPFYPKSNAKLAPGQFWAIPLSDGRFGCGRVLRVDEVRSYGGRTVFVAGLLDWVGAARPTVETIAGAPLLAAGNAHVLVIQRTGEEIIGIRPLDSDGIVVPTTINSGWGFGYPTAVAERRFVHHDPPPMFTRRGVRSPLTDDMHIPLPSQSGVVQFSSMLTDREFIRLANWLRDYPQVTLRAFGSYDKSINNLEFLRFFSFHGRFSADALYHSLKSLNGLRYLPENLEELEIGQTKLNLDLSILERFRNLKTLYLEGQTKGISVLSRLTSLEDLTLRSISLPDLSILLPLTNLLALDIKLGGTKNLSLLPEVGKHRYLELWMVKGLCDISSIGRLPNLRYLFL
jgi:hypothetical protein